jgi:hypothetical protein
MFSRCAARANHGIADTAASVHRTRHVTAWPPTFRRPDKTLSFSKNPPPGTTPKPARPPIRGAAYAFPAATGQNPTFFRISQAWLAGKRLDLPGDLPAPQ